MATCVNANDMACIVLQCPVCLETFTSPRLLPCGHTFCSSCLQTHIDNKATNNGAPQACFPCPVCRAETSASDPNLNTNNWAESFPVNSVLCSLLDTLNKEGSKHSCGLCVMRGQDSQATCYCKDCGQRMCLACKENHNIFPAMRHHDIVDIGDVQHFCFVPSLSNIEICPRHCEERFKFFCDDHTLLCCSTCVTLEHRKCDNIITVKDMLKSLDREKIWTEVEINVSKLEDRLKSIMSVIVENASYVQSSKESILQQIRQIKSHFISKLQKFEDDVVASLNDICKSEVLSIEAQNRQLKSLHSAIESDQAHLAIVAKHGSETQQAIVLHSIWQNQPRYDRVMSEHEQAVSKLEINFVEDDVFHSLTGTLKSLGKINVSIKNIGVTPPPRNINVNDRPPEVCKLVQPALKEKWPIRIGRLDIRMPDDECTCHASHLIQLYDDRIMFIDEYNCRLKLYDKNHVFQDSVYLESGPWSACPLPDNNVAITIPGQRTIHFYSIRQKISKTREIKMGIECYGVAFTNNRLLVTTGSDQHLIRVLNTHGQEVRRFRPFNYRKEELFRPLFIVVNDAKEIILVTYEKGNKFVVYSTSFDVIFIHKNENIFAPRGIDLDQEGNAYLCCYGSQSVLQISPDGKFIRTFMTRKREGKKPFSLAFLRNSNQFIITYGHCDQAEIYDMRDN